LGGDNRSRRREGWVPSPLVAHIGACYFWTDMLFFELTVLSCWLSLMLTMLWLCCIKCRSFLSCQWLIFIVSAVVVSLIYDVYVYTTVELTGVKISPYMGYTLQKVYIMSLIIQTRTVKKYWNVIHYIADNTSQNGSWVQSSTMRITGNKYVTYSTISSINEWNQK